MAKINRPGYNGWVWTKQYKGRKSSIRGFRLIDRLMKEYPCGQINASGLDVGASEGQMGNSEVAPEPGCRQDSLSGLYPCQQGY